MKRSPILKRLLRQNLICRCARCSNGCMRVPRGPRDTMSRRRDVDRSHKSQERSRRRSTRGFVLFCCAAAVCLVLKGPSLLYPRTEGDERIYWQLAQNLANGGDYTLRGSALLKELSAYIYDRPLFHISSVSGASLPIRHRRHGERRRSRVVAGSCARRDCGRHHRTTRAGAQLC